MTPQDIIKKEQLERFEKVSAHGYMSEGALVYDGVPDSIRRENIKSFLSQAIDATREATLLEVEKILDKGYIRVPLSHTSLAINRKISSLTEKLKEMKKL